eukprot:TRINITY_DN48006_c0_g1_i1.p2 TRINITY_DN48006_c0_g1~~TRINITY_DN48006_c0_g1_i1.p2  ORF type:complete len:206 (+),score=57.50 TRINITY_DN48006_c0_g1_i1:62-619(+)
MLPAPQRRASGCLLLASLVAGVVYFAAPCFMQLTGAKGAAAEQSQRLGVEMPLPQLPQLAPSRNQKVEAAGSSMGGAVLAIALAVVAFVFPAPASAEGGACIDLETATAKDLENLSGVGPSLSKRIIEYRKMERTSATKDGRKTWNFNNWATVMKVDGVGSKICEQNVEKVCFGGKVQKSCPAPK